MHKGGENDVKRACMFPGLVGSEYWRGILPTVMQIVRLNGYPIIRLTSASLGTRNGPPLFCNFQIATAGNSGSPTAIYPAYTSEIKTAVGHRGGATYKIDLFRDC